MKSDIDKTLSNYKLSKPLLEQAMANLGANTQEVTLKGRKCKVIRPGKLYPGVWGWDAAFHAIGLAYESGDRGLEELEVSSMGKTSDGRIPSILFYDRQEAEETYYPAPNVWECQSALGLDISGISQPPVFGYALERIITIDPSCKQSAEKIAHLFKVAYEYQQWWYEQRDPEGNGLVVSVHPWETGRDNATDWDNALRRVQQTTPYKEMVFDSALRKDIKDFVDPLHRPIDKDYKMFIYLLEDIKRTNYSIKNDKGDYRKDIPFCMQDVGIIALLQASNESLIRMCDEFGTPAQKQNLEKWSALTSKNARAMLWNEKGKSFQSRDVHSGALTNITNGSFMAMATDIPTQEQAMEMVEMLQLWQEGAVNKQGDIYQVNYNIPSAAPDNISFEPKRYWRGPLWTIVNYVVTVGFFKQAKRFESAVFYQEAFKLMRQTLDVIAQDEGFGGKSSHLTRHV